MVKQFIFCKLLLLAKYAISVASCVPISTLHAALNSIKLFFLLFIFLILLNFCRESRLRRVIFFIGRFDSRLRSARSLEDREPIPSFARRRRSRCKFLSGTERLEHLADRYVSKCVSCGHYRHYRAKKRSKTSRNRSVRLAWIAVAILFMATRLLYAEKKIRNV